MIAKRLINYREAPLGMMSIDNDFRISIAGAQEKTAFLRKDKQWYQPTGATPSSHIFKQPNSDRMQFFKSQILFWLLAAIDGHAKNFSIFIKPYGNYCLTPLYDVMSAYPLIAKKQLQKQKIKMAMALIDKQKHYRWHTMQRKHFLSTAKNVNYSVKLVEEILDDMLSQIDPVIQNVSSKLTSDFRKIVSEPIFQGLLSAKKILTKA